jgi:hypothetical protein
MFPTKFWFIWESSFRGEDFLVIKCYLGIGIYTSVIMGYLGIGIYTSVIMGYLGIGI